MNLAPTRGRRLRGVAAIAGLALSLASCAAGGQSPAPTFAVASRPAASSSAAPPGGSASAGSASTITLTLQEYTITPALVSLKAGTAVTFVAHNGGKIDHALLISGNGLNLATKDLAFAPGQSETISATLAAGTYTFICPVDGHAAQGMKGTITVMP